MKHRRVRGAILEVEDARSVCSACGRDADARQKTHRSVLGGEFVKLLLETPGAKAPRGCGATFVATMSTDFRVDAETLYAFRPDLPMILAWPRLAARR